MRSAVPASVGCLYRAVADATTSPARLAPRGKGGHFDQAIPLEVPTDHEPMSDHRLVAAFPRPRRGFVEGAEGHKAVEVTSFLEVIDALATSMEEVLSLCDEAQPDAPDGLVRYRHQPYMRIPWSRLGERWLRTEPSLDPAPLSLVARVARDHGDHLTALAAAPRRLLIRQREEERIDRIQELDPHCLLDFIQRPGRTLAEKAGRNQTLLGVTRRETIDTLENRVLRDLLLMAERRARAYVVENKTIDRTTSRRLRKTDALRRQIDRVLSTSPLAQASRLSGEVQPNYALLKDSRYQIVWRYWQEFRREERLRRELWSWSRRLWADTVRAAIIVGLYMHVGNTSYLAAGDSGALLRRDHLEGHFFLPSCQSMRFRDPNTGHLLDIIHPEHFPSYPERNLAALLATSGADLAMTRIRPREGTVRPGRCLLVYTFLPMSNRELPRDEILSSIAPTLGLIDGGFRVLVVIGAVGGQEVWTSDDGRFSIATVSPLAPAQFPSLTLLALELLNRKVSKEGGAP